MKISKIVTIAMALFISIAGMLITMQSCQNITNKDDLVKVGIYDSRIVAVAYYRSESYMDYIKQLKKERREAEEAGDKEKMAYLERKGPGLQDLAEKQGFSTMPIPNILEMITDSIPVIAERFGLDVIMNQWEIIYQKDNVEFIDITKELLSFFEPSEETFTMVDQMYDVDPVPLAEILRDDVENWRPEYEEDEK